MSLPGVTVVGLGPGDARFVTTHVVDAIAATPVRFVRTSRHPSAHLVSDATSFDEVYDAADTFDDVYATIVDRLAAAAAEHGHVLYAVPGSPLVLERTVRRLRADERVRCDVLPAISFLDVAYERLGIDPDKVPLTYPRYGNVGPAAIPITLAGVQDTIEVGERVLCMGIGSGLNTSFTEIVW